jgi:DNA-binding NarL/FixJ family response regulator
MIRVILADDQNIVRNGIRNLLEEDGRFEIIGEASGAAAVFELLDKGVIPDIILADIILPELSVLEKIFKLDGISAPKMVLLTVTDGDEHMMQAFKAGAMGYLLKSISPDELIFALSYIHFHNKKYISADLTLRLLDRVRALPQLNHNGHDGVIFSKRETEVLELISEGHTNQQIADKLFTSRRTVEGHRQALMDKAGVSNSAALVKFAFRHKLLQ